MRSWDAEGTSGWRCQAGLGRRFVLLRAGVVATARNIKQRRARDNFESRATADSPDRILPARSHRYGDLPYFQLGLLDEEALGRLLKLFPENTNLSEVRLKVAGFNELYRAGLQSKHIEKIARHIASTANFDALLQQGSPDAAGCIIDCKDVRHYFSFASKYCSWHNPDAYPIYSSEVDECLWRYRGQYTFTRYRRSAYDYKEFLRIMTAFRNYYHLASGFKDLDKFLLAHGERLLLR